MGHQRTPLEELAFRSAALDAAMQAAGFQPALVDQEAAKDFSYRARYLRTRGTLYPRLQANLEYYLATQAFSLRISADASDQYEEKTFYFIVKNYREDLRQLLDRYFDSVRRGAPLVIEEGGR